jgi:hypothetical protein
MMLLNKKKVSFEKMVGKNTLKYYELNSMQDYYDMTIESYINGNRNQALEQFKKMNKKQKLEFIEFVRLNYPDNYNFFMANF